MKAAVLTEIRKIEVRDVPEPSIQKVTDVLLRVAAVGICGSDLQYYSTGRIGSEVVRFPFIIGHECVASVEQVGKDVKKVKPGDTLYVYEYGKDVFDYYYKGNRQGVVIGEPHRDNPQGYYKQLDSIIGKGGGVWFFFTHFRAGKQNDFEIIYKYVAKSCKIKDGIQKTDAAAFMAVCLPADKLNSVNAPIE